MAGKMTCAASDRPRLIACVYTEGIDIRRNIREDLIRTRHQDLQIQRKERPVTTTITTIEGSMDTVRGVRVHPSLLDSHTGHGLAGLGHGGIHSASGRTISVSIYVLYSLLCRHRLYLSEPLR